MYEALERVAGEVGSLEQALAAPDAAARQKSGGPRDEAATPGFHQCVCDSTHFSGE